MRTGVRLRPSTWEELVAAIDDGSAEALSHLGRHPLDLLRYRAFRAGVLEKYATLTDYLLATLFPGRCDAQPNAGVSSMFQEQGCFPSPPPPSPAPPSLPSHFHCSLLWFGMQQGASWLPRYPLIFQTRRSLFGEKTWVVRLPLNRSAFAAPSPLLHHPTTSF